ncbi:MAG TPA: DNA translocase FtsK, partial [Solirubrobacterales bacterium]|nr:DNA translocase FtsK [Solirubrobacterales bacterium]
VFERQKRAPVRKAPARKPKGKAKRGKAARSRGGFGVFDGLEQRHLDLIGLFLVAAGIYLLFVLFFGWEGGKVGYGIETALIYLFGSVGARIFTLLMLIAGGMILTGTSISALARGIGRGLRALFVGGAKGSEATARTVRQGSEEWRRRRGERDGRTAVTRAAKTDVMSDYPDEDDESFAPTVALAEDKDDDIFAPGLFNFDEEEAPTGETQALGSPGTPGREAEDVPDDREAPQSEPDPDHSRIPSGSGSDRRAAAEDSDEDRPAPTPMGNLRGVTTSEEIDYRMPSPRVLERGKGDKGPDPRDQQATGRKLIETLGHFGVDAKIVGVVSGPHVSLYELRLAPGIKVKKVTELANDLAYALASTDIRILAPIPGKQAVGVEVPNAKRRMVRLGDIYQGRPAKASPLVAWLGKGIDGNAVWTDIAKMPHVLVAGTTGSGKSACVNAMLSSILMASSPNEVRLVLVDPKQVELNHYEHVPHLLTPVVTSPRLAANVLANLITEMETRYGVMSQARARNLEELNRIRRKAGEAPLPHILCVIDELADLMMVAPAEVEDSIIRLAQKSRATGIHLVLATQRPSTDIITGTIKVNIPSRIAFAVSSQTDSRVILDQGGAESLLGQGDMLFRGAGTSKLARVQGAFITEDEIAAITEHWARQGEPEFEEELLETPEGAEDEGGRGEDDFDPDSDDLLDEAIRLVVQTETASVSMIQRRLRVGYTRAGRLIDMLERRGVISGYEGSKPRQVLITQADLARVVGGPGSGGGGGEASPEPSPVGAEPGNDAS